MGTLKLTVERGACRVTRVIAVGEIDNTNYEDLSKTIDTEVDLLSGSGRIVLDLYDLVFMDSQGLGVVIQSKKYADLHRVDLILEIKKKENAVKRLLRLVQDQLKLPIICRK